MNRRCMTQGRRSLLHVLLALAAGLLGTGTAYAEANENIAGTWRALMKTPQGDIEILMTLEHAEGAWSGTISDPTGSGRDLTPDALSVDGNTVSFNFRPEGTPFPASFFGNYMPDDDIIRGTFSIAGRSSPLTRFERTSELPEGLRPAAGEEEPRGRQRHFTAFGVALRVNYWQPIHLVEDEVRTMNDLTTGKLNFDGGLRWYLMDGLAIFGRYFRGGQGFDTAEIDLAPFADIGLGKESYLKLDGYEFGFNAYAGNALFPESRFNPYLTVAAGRTDWELTTGARGSEAVVIGEKALQDEDWHVGAGLGTEYEVSRRFAVELEWFWRFIMTKDKDQWPDTVKREYWTNTHLWNLSLGLVVNF